MLNAWTQWTLYYNPHAYKHFLLSDNTAGDEKKLFPLTVRRSKDKSVSFRNLVNIVPQFTLALIMQVRSENLISFNLPTHLLTGSLASSFSDP